MTISTALYIGRWIDAAISIAQAMCELPEETGFANKKQTGRRIDVIQCNKVAAESLVECAVMPNTGIPLANRCRRT